MLLSHGFLGFRGCNFLRFMYTKVTQRSYSYFAKFSYFGFWRKRLFQLSQNLHNLVKKTQGILGIKRILKESLWLLSSRRVFMETSKTRGEVAQRVVCGLEG